MKRFKRRSKAVGSNPTSRYIGGYAVGYAWVFENVVVYGNPIQLGKRLKSQLGEFFGIVKGVIPYDPYFVLYERIKHTKAWLKRHPQRTLVKWLYPKEDSG